jgi:DNA repair protein RadC
MIKYSEYEQEAIKVALSAIEKTLANNDSMQSTKEVENYLKIQLASQPDEWFAVLFLTSQHRLIRSERLFRGTVNSSHVHVRIIARKALELSAAAVILAHNHPSGIAEPSSADRGITTRIKDALEVFDIDVLDHFVVTSGECFSFANRGWL